jgi:hypothetical protein
MNGGYFSAAGLSIDGRPFPHAWYLVEVLAYFNGPWRQSDAVLSVVGREGVFLAGRFAEPVYPELADPERRLHAVFECVAPPLTAAPPRAVADLGAAVALVQDAVLVVGGRRSAAPVVEVVADFMRAPGLREREGWSAEAQPNGALLVRYSFWNGEKPDVAEWLAILDSGEVRYRNRNGRHFSWGPDD